MSFFYKNVRSGMFIYNSKFEGVINKHGVFRNSYDKELEFVDSQFATWGVIQVDELVKN